MEDGWFPDPTGRYTERYVVRSQWSALVRRGATESIDAPLGCPEIPVARDKAPQLAVSSPSPQVAPVPWTPPVPPPPGIDGGLPTTVTLARHALPSRRFTMLPRVSWGWFIGALLMGNLASFVAVLGRDRSGILEGRSLGASAACLGLAYVCIRLGARRFDPSKVTSAGWIVRRVLGWAYLVGVVLTIGSGVRDATRSASELADSQPLSPESSRRVDAGWQAELAAIVPDLEATTGLEFSAIVGLESDPAHVPLVIEQRWPTQWLSDQLALLRAMGLADGNDTVDDLLGLLGAEPGVVSAVYDPQQRVIMTVDQPRRGDLAIALAHALLDQHGRLPPRGALLGPAADVQILTLIRFDVALFDPAMAPREWSPVDWVDSPVGARSLPSRSGEPGRPLAGLTDVWSALLLLSADPEGKLGFASPDQQTATDQYGPTAVAPEPVLGPDERLIGDLSAGDVGPVTWSVALAGRVDPRGAVKAAMGWTDGHSVVVDRAGTLCVRSTNTFVTDTDAAQFAYVVLLWAGPVGASAQVSQPQPNSVEVLVCDPGGTGPADESRSEVVPGSLIARSVFGQGFAANTPTGQLHCAAERFVDVATEELDDMTEGNYGNLPQELLAACAAG